MATQFSQTPTRVNVRGGRRSGTQLINELMPETQTAAVSNDLLSQLMRDPQQMQQIIRRRQEATQPQAQTNPAANLPRLLSRMGPQGSAATLQRLMIDQEKQAKRQREDGQGNTTDRQSNGEAAGANATVGTGPMPGWASAIGRPVLGAMLGALGPAGAVAGIAAQNWSNDSAATGANLATRAINMAMPDSVRQLLGVLKMVNVDPVKDMVTNPIAEAIRENVTKPVRPVAPDTASALAPAAPAAPAESAPANTDSEWAYDPISDTWSFTGDSRNRADGATRGGRQNGGSGGSGSEFSAYTPSGTVTVGRPTAGTAGVTSADHGMTGSYGGGGGGGYGQSSGSGQRAGSGDGGGTSSSGY